MRALVTGATGLLGHRLVRQLLDQQWSVTALLRPRSSRAILDLPGVGSETCDLSVDSLDPDWFRGAEAVFHTAAAVTDWAPWPYYVANTIDATRRIVNAMTAAGCRRLIHVSTVGVYGRPTTDQPIREDQPSASMGRWDYYTRAKIEAERIVWRAQEEGHLAVTVLRPAMVYGPSDRGLVSRVIGLLRAGRIALVGDTDFQLPLAHVDDVARAALLLATTEITAGEAFNVAGTEPVTQQAFFNAIASLCGLPPVRRRLPYRLAYAAGLAAEIMAHTFHTKTGPPVSRYRVSLFGHRRRYATEKLRSAVPWQPEVRFADGIREAVEWHLRNKN